MRQAADTLEEASRVYGAFDPKHYMWAPWQLREEANHIEADTAYCNRCGYPHVEGRHTR